MPEHDGDSQHPGVKRSHWGLLDVLIVDNGPEFKSANLEDVIRGLNDQMPAANIRIASPLR